MDFTKLGYCEGKWGKCDKMTFSDCILNFFKTLNSEKLVTGESLEFDLYNSPVVQDLLVGLKTPVDFLQHKHPAYLVPTHIITDIYKIQFTRIKSKFGNQNMVFKGKMYINPQDIGSVVIDVDITPQNLPSLINVDRLDLVLSLILDELRQDKMISQDLLTNGGFGEW